jgi:hypothetical protein
MSARDSFDDALNSAIDALARGEHIDSVLAREPRHAAALRPLLESAPFGGAETVRAEAAMSPRLADNFSIVRAAVQRTQMAHAPIAPRIAPQAAPWWQRRLAFASLSLPAGVVALAAFAGISGAAAASVAVTGSDFPARVAEFVTHPLPVIGSSHDGDDRAVANAPAGAATAAAGAQSTPPSANAPTLVTVSGTISDAHGNVFTLTAADGEYKVNTDGTTEITGTIADGATATVTGDATAQKNLHAKRVDAAGAPDATPTEPGNGNGNSNGPQNDATPETTPDPENDKTPGPQNDRTPGPPDGHTTGPPGVHTPPGGGGANGNGNGNGGGNSEKP